MVKRAGHFLNKNMTNQTLQGKIHVDGNGDWVVELCQDNFCGQACNASLGIASVTALDRLCHNLENEAKRQEKLNLPRFDVSPETSAIDVSTTQSALGVYICQLEFKETGATYYALRVIGVDGVYIVGKKLTKNPHRATTWVHLEGVKAFAQANYNLCPAP